MMNSLISNDSINGHFYICVRYAVYHLNYYNRQISNGSLVDCTSAIVEVITVIALHVAVYRIFYYFAPYELHMSRACKLRQFYQSIYLSSVS